MSELMTMVCCALSRNVYKGEFIVKKLVILLSLCVSGFALAVTATVDIMQVVKSLPNYEKLESDLQKEVSIATNKLHAKKDQLDAKVQEIEDKSETISQQRLTRLRREATSLRRELSFMEEDLQNNLTALEQDMKTSLMKDAQEAIEKYAQNNDIEVIVSNEFVVFSSNSVDVTDQVISSLS